MERKGERREKTLGGNIPEPGLFPCGGRNIPDICPVE